MKKTGMAVHASRGERNCAGTAVILILDKFIALLGHLGEYVFHCLCGNGGSAIVEIALVYHARGGRKNAVHQLVLLSRDDQEVLAGRFPRVQLSLPGAYRPVSLPPGPAIGHEGQKSRRIRH